MKPFNRKTLFSLIAGLAISTGAHALTIERVPITESEVRRQMAVTDEIKVGYFFSYTCPYCPRIESAINTIAERFDENVSLTKTHVSDSIIQLRYKLVYEFIEFSERPDLHSEMYTFAQKEGRKFEKSDAPLEKFFDKHGLSIADFNQFLKDNGYEALQRPTIAMSDMIKREKKAGTYVEPESKASLDDVKLGSSMLTPTVTVNNNTMINGRTAGGWENIPDHLVEAIVEEMKSQINR